MALSFDVLYEEDGLPRFDLPETLKRICGGFGLPDDVLYANFVATVDGVADMADVPKSSSIISGGHPSDRFMVGLLRAAADAVVIGAGTFRAHGGPWTAEKAYPDCAEAFGEVRRRMHLEPAPRQVVVTSSGRIDAAAPKLRSTLVLTSRAGARALEAHAADGFEVLAVQEDAGPIDVARVAEALADRGYRRVLTEGGPRLMGQLVASGAVDELFLSVSPQLAGGGLDGSHSNLAAGVEILPGERLPARLLSVRRSDSYLFLRYALEAGTAARP